MKFIQVASPLTRIIARWLLVAGAVAVTIFLLASAQIIISDRIAKYDNMSLSPTGTIASDARLIRKRGNLVCGEPGKIHISGSSSKYPGENPAARAILLREKSWQLCNARISGVITREQYSSALLSLIKEEGRGFEISSPRTIISPARENSTRRMRHRLPSKKCKCPYS